MNFIIPCNNVVKTGLIVSFVYRNCPLIVKRIFGNRNTFNIFSFTRLIVKREQNKTKSAV